jgi:hypothetical protein
MNQLILENPINPLDNVKQTDQGANGPVLNPDPLIEKASLDPALIHEASMGVTDENIVHAASMGEVVPLISREESEHFRTRWNEIQGKFVDEPRSAVQQADELVSEVVKKIIQMFASEHSSLDSQWNQGIDVSTEDLRKALQHYRSFFNRLVV